MKKKKKHQIAERLKLKKLKQINRPLYFTRSTLKYMLIALVTLALIGTFLLLIVIGALNLYACHSDQLAVYLLFMGCASLLRILLFYSCPFHYSQSLLSKLYEHLIWRLVVNRCRASYNAAIQMSSSLASTSASPAAANSKPKRVHFDEKRRRNLNRAKFVCSFLFNFCQCFCCCLCCYSVFNCFDEPDDEDEAAKEELERGEKEAIRKKMMPTVPTFTLVDETTKTSDSFLFDLDSPVKLNEDHYLKPSKSCTSISRLTDSSGLSILINDINLNCFSFMTTTGANESGGGAATSREHSRSESFTMSDLNSQRSSNLVKQSASAHDFTAYSALKKNSNNNLLTSNESERKTMRRSITFDASTSSKRSSLWRHKYNYFKYHHGHFTHSHGKYFGAHRKVRLHHNRMQRRYRILDCNSIRFGLTSVLQRLLDIFIVVWFICGNYWVFNYEMNSTTPIVQLVPADLFARLNQTITVTTLRNESSLNATSRPHPSQLGVNLTSLLDDSTFKCDSSFSFQIAFSQIIVTYLIFGSLLVLLTSYRIYSIISCQKRVKEQKSKRLNGRSSNGRAVTRTRRGGGVGSNLNTKNLHSFSRNKFYYNPRFHQRPSTTHVSICEQI